MREISPALNASADEYFSIVPEPLQSIITLIRAEKERGSRSRPSAKLIDRSALLTSGKRAALLDKVAELVDENLTGRSDMCLQFTALMNLALRYLGFKSYAVTGTVTYLSSNGKRIYSWRHGWVRVGEEVIDGNTDSMTENPTIPRGFNAEPYWGPIHEFSKRSYAQGGYVDDDPDVNETWWPDLKEWLTNEFTEID